MNRWDITQGETDPAVLPALPVAEAVAAKEQKQQNSTAAHCSVQFCDVVYFIILSNASKVLRNATYA